MKKRTFITCVLAGEAAAIVLTLVNTHVPGKLIDALVYEGDLEFSSAMFLSGIRRMQNMSFGTSVLRWSRGKSLF